MGSTSRDTGDFLCNPEVGRGGGLFLWTEADCLVLSSAEAVTEWLQGCEEEGCRGWEMADGESDGCRHRTRSGRVGVERRVGKR